MKPRTLYLLQTALAIAAAVALVLLANQHGPRTGLGTLLPWVR